MWRDFCAPADAVVFLIDASDTSRFSVSKRELDSLLADEQVSNNTVQVCIGNHRAKSSVGPGPFTYSCSLLQC